MPKKDEVISEKILDIIRTHSPENVERLIEQAQIEINISRKAALEHIVQLHNEGKLNLTPPMKLAPSRLRTYVQSLDAAWFWTIIAISISTAVTVFTISENTYPLVFIRYAMGSIFVLFLPGYCLIKTLFPLKEIDNLERMALSIGTSLALVPLVGLLLNYTPWGIRLTPITISLLSLTIMLAISGLIREHRRYGLMREH